MCGIAAIFNYRTGEPIDRAELTAIRDAMAARGPDGFGNWFTPDGRLGLGHRRLAIIDLSPTGAQPMLNHDASLAITFNGEIYNYRQLRAGLDAKGCRFTSESDTEVLLHLYQLEGEAMLLKLRGMYAFAIWDERKKGLFLARDPFGIKPLYYADDGQTIRVASQVKALLAGGRIDTTPEPAGHVGFFLWGHVPAPFTFYRAISGLTAGHSMWLPQNGAPQIRSFCSIPEIFAQAEARSAERGLRSTERGSQLLGPPKPGDGGSTFNSLARHSGATAAQPMERLRSALSDSVRHHLVADVPVGVFLSSGLDSTTLTALASQDSASLRTVTLGFEEFRGTSDDEVPLAAQVAAQYGARHQTIWVSKQDFRDQFSRLMRAMDQPTCDGVNSFFISHAAARAGLKVALSGLGGDELFGSYPSFRDIPRSVRFLSRFNASSLQRFNELFRLVAAPVMKRLTSPKYAGLLEYGGTYGGAYLLRRGMFMPWELPELLDPDLVREGWDRLQTLARLEVTTRDLQSPRLRVSALEMTWYMRHQLLRDTDWASMDHSLEVRAPLVDVQLLQDLAPLLAGTHPPTKHDMALSVGSPVVPSSCSALPPSVLNRRKTGFVVPVRDWLVQEDTGFQHERGLRGWTRLVYSALLGDRGDPLHLTRAALGRAPMQTARPPDHRTTRPSRGPVVPLSRGPVVRRKVLVFRIGQLGDTIAALPAMWAVRKHFKDAQLTLLCDRHPEKTYVFGPDLLRGSGLFEQFDFYPVRDGSINGVHRAKDMLRLLARLRRAKFDTLVYLSPSARRQMQIARDVRFFRLAGIKHFIGTDGFAALPARTPGQPLEQTPREAELLLARLAASGIRIPPSGRGSMDLHLGHAEEQEFREWLRTQDHQTAGLLDYRTRDPRDPASCGPVVPLSRGPADLFVAFAPGSKMPAKRWPLDRFIEVGRTLIEYFDIWPIVFGGAEDAADGERLLRAWGRGYNAAGRLSLRASAAALGQCGLYVGNDTGTMHLAASVGTRCVAIFSARDWPGRWYPYGSGHCVLRAAIDCEGCGLIECVERNNECLARITTAQVIEQCEEILSEEKVESRNPQYLRIAESRKQKQSASPDAEN